MPSNTCSNLAESAFKHLVQIFFFIQIFVDNFEFAYDLSILHTTNGISLFKHYFILLILFSMNHFHLFMVTREEQMKVYKLFV